MTKTRVYRPATYETSSSIQTVLHSVVYCVLSSDPALFMRTLLEQPGNRFGPRQLLEGSSTSKRPPQPASF